MSSIYQLQGISTRDLVLAASLSMLIGCIHDDAGLLKSGACIGAWRGAKYGCESWWLREVSSNKFVS
jgi:hypothetical protein